MIDAEFDLLPGQIDYDSRVPANYSTPDGYFVGEGYRWDKEKPEPIYSRHPERKQHFLPSLFKMPYEFTNDVQDFITSRVPTFTLPETYNKNTYIGVGHKLSKMEISNMMMAFRTTGYLPLDDKDVQKVVKNQFNKLQPTLGKTTESVMRNLHRPLEVFDKEKSIFVVSFKNGISSDTIRKVFVLDYQRAVNIIQKIVKAPINDNQFKALISLAFDVEEKRLIQSKLINKINNKEYSTAAQHFLDFSMIETDYSHIVSESLYQRRITEASLFASL